MDHLIDWHLLGDDVWKKQIALAREYASHRGARLSPVAAGRGVALLFFNPSLRTRTSMEVAGASLGAHSSVIVPGQGTWGFAWEEGVRMGGLEAEHIKEAAGVLSQYFDAIGVRLFASLTDREADRQERLLHTFVEAATVPVINLESAYYHPCQALADAATMAERFDGHPEGKRFVLTWASHPKALPTAVPNSALLAAARSGMQVTIARPEGFDLDPAVVAMASQYGRVEVTDQMDDAIAGADIVYAKAWSGQSIYTDPESEAKRRAAHSDWCVTGKQMSSTRDGRFMHCLPVRRGVVVADEVLDGPQTLHLRQAAYRLFAQQAVLSSLWNLPSPESTPFPAAAESAERA